MATIEVLPIVCLVSCIVHAQVLMIKGVTG